MRIGILGAGGMAEALGGQWARTDHEVFVGARDRAKATALAGRLGSRARAGGLHEAAEHAEVVLLAVPYTAVDEVLAATGDALRGRPLADCVNALAHPGAPLATGNGPSMAERVAALSGAKVIKAFNLCHVSVWRRTPPRFGGSPLAVPVCGDDPAALAAVRTLVADIGCAPLDAGGLARARLLEATAAFAIGVWSGGGDPRSMFPPLEYAHG